MTHQLDFDDTHDKAVVHPTANSLPIALAIGERQGADLQTLIEAVAVGNEVACRLGDALTGLLFDHPWVRPPVLGMFGAVAAGARMLRLTAQEVANAWGLVLPRVGGTLACLVQPGSWVRTMRDAFSADSAALALELARRGVKGEREPFEGQYGLFQAYFVGGYRPADVLRGLGDWFTAEAVSIKPWPCCREVHGTLTALSDILQTHHVSGEEIEAIRIRVGNTNLELCEPGHLRRNPRHVTDALCNVPFNVAVGALHGYIPLDAYTAAGLRDPRVTAMAERVTWTHDPEQDRAGTLEPGAVRLDLADGRTYERVAEVSRGHPDWPLTLEQLRTKFLDCFHVSESLSSSCGTDLLGLVLNGEPEVPLRHLTSHLRPESRIR